MIKSKNWLLYNFLILKEYYLTLSLLEFIEIDNNIPIEDLVNDQEIIDLVLHEDSESSDTNEEVEILKSISYSEAHSAIQTTLMFLEQNRNDNIKVDRDNLLLLRRLLRDIEKEKINYLKQTQLNWFAATPNWNKNNNNERVYRIITWVHNFIPV